jgi:hypothetical protein
VAPISLKSGHVITSLSLLSRLYPKFDPDNTSVSNSPQVSFTKSDQEEIFGEEVLEWILPQIYIHPLFVNFLNTILSNLNNFLHPIIIQVKAVDILCELISTLNGELKTLDNPSVYSSLTIPPVHLLVWPHVQNIAISPYREYLNSLVKDVQDKLILGIQNYIKIEITNHSFMLKQILVSIPKEQTSTDVESHSETDINVSAPQDVNTVLVVEGPNISTIESTTDENTPKIVSQPRRGFLTRMVVGSYTAVAGYLGGGKKKEDSIAIEEVNGSESKKQLREDTSKATVATNEIILARNFPPLEKTLKLLYKIYFVLKVC